MSLNLNEAEAKKEHDDIQAEIAKEKGIKVDEPAPAKPEDKLEAKEGEDKEPAPEGKDGKPDEPEKPEDSKEGDEKDPEDPPTRTDRRIPLSKFQDLKRELREQTEAKDKEIAQLKKDLEDTKTAKEVGVVIKEFADKHNVSEDFAKDLLNMAKAAMPKVDTSKIEAFTKKQEAIQAFESEFGTLIKDIPDAADLKEKIRQEAYKEGNLDKSLFEVYKRYIEPTLEGKPERRKTGEVGRGPASVRNGPAAFDPKKVAEDLKNNIPNVLSKLSDSQVDEVFAYMEKTGSNYKS